MGWLDWNSPLPHIFGLLEGKKLQGLSSIPEEEEEETMTIPPLGLRENGCCLVEGRRGRAGNSKPDLGPCGLCLLSQRSLL